MISRSATKQLSRLATLSTIASWSVCGAFYYACDGFTTGNFVGLMVICLAAIYATLRLPFASRGALLTVAVAVTAMGVGVILNTHLFTTGLGGTPEAPVLVNYDESRWWNGALWAAGYAPDAVPEMHLLYVDILGVVLRIFGPTVGVALLVSVLCSITALLAGALLAYRLTAESRIAVLAMAATAAVAYWLTMGTLLLKEPLIIMAVAVGACGLVASRRTTMSACVALSAILLATARPNYIFILILGLAVVPGRRRLVVARVVLAGVCLVAWRLADLWAYNPDAAMLISAHSGDGIDYGHENQQPLKDLFGDYYDMSTGRKILMLPVSALVQFLIPFPWNFMRDVPFGMTELWAHVAYPWYAFGAIFVFGLFTRLRHLGGTAVRLTLWGFAAWLIPCYLFGGTISRYGLPAVIPMAPLVAMTLVNSYKSRAFHIYLLLFTVILISGLLVCHHLQTARLA